MKDMLDYLMAAGIITLIVWMIFGFIHMMLKIFLVWDVMAINVKLPKRKRFLTKVDPIYRLRGTDYSGYMIEKWELGYDDEFGLQLLMVFIPYPIKILKYKYINCNCVWLSDDIKIDENIEDISIMYEKLWAEQNAVKIENRRIGKEYLDNLDRINKVFNENFES